MTNSQRVKCHATIHTATAACAAVGGGMAQLPGSDALPISAAQVAMVMGLGKVFDMSITEAAAKAILAGVAGAAYGRWVSQVLLGWMPGVGNAINAVTAATLTEILGWKIAEKFDREAEQQIKA